MYKQGKFAKYIIIHVTSHQLMLFQLISAIACWQFRSVDSVAMQIYVIQYMQLKFTFEICNRVSTRYLVTVVKEKLFDIHNVVLDFYSNLTVEFMPHLFALDTNAIGRICIKFS